MPGAAGPPTPGANWLYRFVARAFLAVMQVQRWRFTVQGLDHVPRTGGAVIAANHTSFWDFFTTGRGPYLAWGRPVRILAKASLFELPVVGPIMRRAGHVPVHRGAGGRALSSAIAALQAGELVLVLPEQTINPAFELLPFKRGAAHMAAVAGVPLVPAVSWGSHRFHTVDRRPRWSWRLPVTVAYGPPLHPRPEDPASEVTAELQRRIDALLAEVQCAYPDGTPAGAWWVPARLGGAAPTPEVAEAYLREVAQRWAVARRRRAAGRRRWPARRRRAR